MKLIVEIDYTPNENETFEESFEIITNNIENCIGKVISVKEKEKDDVC